MPIKEVTVFDNGKKINKNEISSKHAGIVVSFGSQTKAKPILVKVSSSFISDEQAVTNLKELKNHSFEQIAKKGRKIWNDKLGQLAIESDNLDEMKTFYSTLYRTLFFPNKLYEIDEKNNVVYYSPYNGKVCLAELVFGIRLGRYIHFLIWFIRQSMSKCKKVWRMRTKKEVFCQNGVALDMLIL